MSKTSEKEKVLKEKERDEIKFPFGGYGEADVERGR